MKAWLISFLLVLGTIIALSLISTSVNAESLSVSLRVGDTRISFDGYASPNAFITVKQDGSVIGTTVADISGNWSKTMDAYNPGIQSFDLYATDINSLLTPTITYNVNLVANTLTTISNIVFPPTILTGTLPTLQTDSLTLSGMTHPLSTLTLLISDGNTHTITPASDGTGSITISMEDSSGAYTAYITATMPGNYISLASDSVSYTITAPSSPTPTPSASPSVSSAAPSAVSSPSITPSIVAIPRTRITTPSPTPITPGISEIIAPIENFYTYARSILNIKTVLIVLALLASIRTIIFIIAFISKNKSKKHKQS